MNNNSLGQRALLAVAMLIATLGLIVSCGASADAIPSVDVKTNPTGAYAAEIRYQYDLINAGYKKGSLDAKDVTAYLASWDRLVANFPASNAAYANLTDQEKAADLEKNFKYPWISGGTFLKDGTLNEQNGFYGAAVNKNTGDLMADWSMSSLYLYVLTNADPNNAKVLAYLIGTFNGVFVDLDKIVKPDQKKELGQQIILKMIACYPNLGLTDEKLMTSLQGAAGFGMMRGAPVLKSWLGY